MCEKSHLGWTERVAEEAPGQSLGALKALKGPGFSLFWTPRAIALKVWLGGMLAWLCDSSSLGLQFWFWTPGAAAPRSEESPLSCGEQLGRKTAV